MFGLFAVISILCLMMGFGALTSGHAFGLLFFLPMVFLVRSAKNKRKLGREQFMSFVELQGGSDYLDFIALNISNFSGIAVNTNKKQIFLTKNGIHKAYPFESIRKWEGEKTHVLQSSGGTVADAVRAGQYQDETTGLFVTVKDVDFPVWHICFHSKKEIDRWMEILKQTVKGE